MKAIKIAVPVLAMFLAGSLASYTMGYRQTEPIREDVLMQLVTGALDYIHYNPPRLDDNFSSDMFDAFIKSMDYNKQFYTQEDISELESYRSFLDESISQNNFDFYQKAVSKYKTRLAQTKVFAEEILNSPLDLYTERSLETDYDKTEYAKDDESLKQFWRDMLTYQVVTRIYDIRQDSTSEKASKPVEELETETRERVRKLYDDYFKRLERMEDNDYMSLYVNAITMVFDPHTQYLPPDDKESFDISMSGQFEGIGATLQESEGYVKVVELVPGSPSWMSGKVKVNDLIQKVRQDDETDGLDVYGVPLNDVVKKIRGKKGTGVNLTIKHADGMSEEIRLVRDVIIIEETYAKSAILTDSLTGKRMGYIDLPKFYVDFNHTETGRSCADDVAAELEKLKAEGVEGIILDLRNNGGGSLPDAVRMSGLFIPKGPIVQVSQKNGKKQVLADTDSKVQYEGNLVILVNPSSASASEILAAAMQDYNRAIIMGSNTTFGKGTVQTVVDLNQMLRESAAEKGKVGSMLVTIQKFFRINGGSTQLKGVRPDIVVPDAYTEMEIGERNEDFPLPWTEIDAAEYEPYDNEARFEEAIRQSKARIDTSSYFRLLRQQVDMIKTQREDSRVPLNLDAYTERLLARKAENKSLDERLGQKTTVKASILAVDQLPADADTVKIGRNNRWLGGIEKDVYLEEAVRVLESMN